MLESKPPDGGWGWVVAICSFVNHAFIFGFFYSMGVFYVSWLDDFGMNKSTTSWIMSTGISLAYISGPIAGNVASRLGYRCTTMLGGFLAACGLALSFMANSVPFLIITVGVITGVSFGFVHMSSLAIVALYFDKKRALATSIGVSGAGVSSFFMPPIVNTLSEWYGWRGAMLVQGAITFNICIAGLLMRPLRTISCADKDLDFGESDDQFIKGRKWKRPKRKDMIENSEIICAEASAETETNPLMQLNIDFEGNMDVASEKPQDENIRPDLTVSTNSEEKEKEVYKDYNAPEMSASAIQIEQYSANLIGSDNIPEKQNPLDYNRINKGEDLDPNLKKQFSRIPIRVSMSSPAIQNDNFEIDTYDKQIMGLEGGNSKSNRQSFISKSSFKRFHLLATGWKQSFMSQIQSNIELLKDPAFLLYTISQTLNCASYLTPVIFLVDRAIDNGITRSEGAWLISCNGIGSFVGRIVFGILADFLPARHLTLYILASVIAGISTMLSPLCGGVFFLHGAYACLFGFSMGGVCTVCVVLVVDLVGLEKTALAIGVFLLFAGIGHLLGPPTAGFIFDVTKSYTWSYLCQGFILTCSGLMLIPIYCIRKGTTIY